MKKAFLAAIALCVVAAFFFWGSPRRVPGHEGQAFSPMAPVAYPPTEPPLKAGAAEEAISEKSEALSAATRQAVKECWGKDAGSWKEIQRGFQALAEGGRREMQWRILRTEEEGREVRIRLSREPGENGEARLEVKLYSVDEEGLPDALPARPGQREDPAAWLNNYLRGKALLSDTKLEEIPLPDGRTLSLESEQGAVVEAQVQGHTRAGAKGLACSRKENDPRCQCL